jgi:flagellar protein FlaI
LGLNLVLLQAQVKVKNRRTRRIKELAEIIGIEPTTSEIVANSIYKWIPARDEFRYSGHSKLYEKIMDLENMTAEEVMVELKQRQDVIEWMVQTKGKWEDDVKKGTREKDWGHVQLATLVNEYYRDSGPVVERIRRELEEYASAEVQI